VARPDPPPLGRRTLLGLAGLGAASLTSCASASSPTRPEATPTSGSPTSSTSSSSHTAPPAPSRRSASRSDLTHGPRASDAVALTFHGAGDPALVNRLVDITRAHGGRVTVLAVGVWAAANPTVLHRLLDAGHEVGNHTWSHQTMPRLSRPEIWSEIDRGAAELRRQIGSIGAWFRPSETPRSTPAIRAAADRAGYPVCLSYDVDSLDYTDPGPAAIVRTISGRVRSGSIVSLHLGHPGTMTALPTVLTMLHQRHLRAVTAGELMAAG
jgi:peptidoglycan/xylan/chitin deacetylase (PgdA/CDA1 family)